MEKMLRWYSSTQTCVNTTNSSLWRLNDLKDEKIKKHDKSVKTLYIFNAQQIWRCHVKKDLSTIQI